MKNNTEILPALRGVMGDWVYYTCLMSIDKVADRVSYAEEIHKNKELSNLIQRSLQNSRARSVAEYLQKQEERFFNSLVVATYGGQPQWSPIGKVNSESNPELANNVDEDAISSLGFLMLNGDERLFALDGQHRLAGIKKAVKEGVDDDPYDEVSVIFVAHDNESSAGLERTRRLFTTLNKTAKPISKGDTIALDEDDVMAITTRNLIENSDIFNDKKIAFVSKNNLPVKNSWSLTTIGNLYDLLTILFTQVNTDLRKSKAELIKFRPDNEELDGYYNLAYGFFTKLAKNVPELADYFYSQNYENVAPKYRNETGGSVLFRPIGLLVLLQVVKKLTKKYSLDDAISLVSKLPRDMSSAPYAGLMWDVNKRVMVNSHKVTTREMLMFMLGERCEFDEEELLDRYRRETGIDDIELPEKINC